MLGYIFKFGNTPFEPSGELTELSDEEIAEHNRKLADAEVKQALEAGKATFYLRREWDSTCSWIAHYSVGTWDGSYKWDAVVSISDHNMAGKNGRIDCWFNINNQKWHGVNIGDNEIVHAKRLKSR